MSEFEDFWLSWYRKNFLENLEKLKSVETREELKNVNEQLEQARNELLSRDPEFKVFVEANQNMLRGKMPDFIKEHRDEKMRGENQKSSFSLPTGGSMPWQQPLGMRKRRPPT